MHNQGPHHLRTADRDESVKGSASVGVCLILAGSVILSACGPVHGDRPTFAQSSAVASVTMTGSASSTATTSSAVATRGPTTSATDTGTANPVATASATAIATSTQSATDIASATGTGIGTGTGPITGTGVDTGVLTVTNATTATSTGAATSASVCPAPVRPGLPLLSDFSSTSWNQPRWGAAGGLSGTIFSYAATATGNTASFAVDATQANVVLAGNVAASGYIGAGMSLDGACANATDYKGIQFTLGGTVAGCDLIFQLRTYAQLPTSSNGVCASDCYQFPQIRLPTTTGMIVIAFATLADTGQPAAAADIAKSIMGLQWQLQSPAGKACTGVKMTVDDVKFVK